MNLLTENNINKPITDLNCPVKSRTISPENDLKPWIDQSMKNQMNTC